MNTLEDLVATGAIVRIEIELDGGALPKRLLFGTPAFVGWLEEHLDAMKNSPLGGDLSPVEQLDHLFYAFVSGKVLACTRQFRAIRSEPRAVWELKTLDLRIFGWFPMKDCFVAVFGDWADRVKDHDLYRGYRLQVRRLRRQLGVDRTLCVEGVNPDDVLSV